MTRQPSALELRGLVFHLGRIALGLAFFAAAIAVDSFALGAAAGLAFLVAGFSFNHDLVHGALGLSRAARHRWMMFAGTVMGLSAHSIRVSHLLHHARPLTDDDFEAASAHLSPIRALVAAPAGSLALRVAGFRRGGATSRRWQLAETLLNVATFALLLGSMHPAALGVAFGLAAGQISMPFWAGHVPHRTPAWLLRLARTLVQWRPLSYSAALLALAYHDAHHLHPRVPTHRLPEIGTAS